MDLTVRIFYMIAAMRPLLPPVILSALAGTVLGLPASAEATQGPMAAAAGHAAKLASKSGAIDWISTADYPADALRKERSGLVNVEIALDERGTPYSCVVIISSGTASLDDMVCKLALKRGKFEPARDESGQPIVGAVRTSFIWTLPMEPPRHFVVSPDLDVAVKALPESPSPPIVGVRQVQRADSSIESCAIDRPSGITALDSMACGLAAQLSDRPPLSDARGNPVRGLRLRTVRFLPQKAQ